MLQFFINCLFITQYISFTNEMNYVSTWNHVNFLNTDIALNSSSSFQAIAPKFNFSFIWFL